jgi:F420-non-reducing hydrogenase small subunit
MTPKPKIALYWCGACGGCDAATIDLDEVLLEVAEQADIVLWPAALDYKYASLHDLAEGELALSMIWGGIRNEEHREMAQLLRQKSRLVLAFGACAVLGGTPGLANLLELEGMLDWIYRQAPTVVNPDGVIPGGTVPVAEGEVSIPRLLPHLYPLDQVIDVDYYLPGCPPPGDLIITAVTAALSGKLPPHGSVLAPSQALCDVCPRNRSKPYRMELRRLRRVHEVELDEETCFLARGVLCLGPATRAGCGGSCLRANTPCRGCFGPAGTVADSGARFLAALAALIKADDDRELEAILEDFLDPAGYCCRFSEATSILGSRQKKGDE